MTQLFKLQRPVGGDMGYCIAYPASRNPTVQVPYDDDAKALFASKGNPEKLYVNARVSRRGHFFIASVPRNQQREW